MLNPTPHATLSLSHWVDRCKNPTRESNTSHSQAPEDMVEAAMAQAYKDANAVYLSLPPATLRTL